MGFPDLALYHERLQARKQRVVTTGTKLGLTANNAVIIGGAGFALHGLNTRVDDRSGHRFDVDAFLSDPKFYEIRRRHRLANRANYGSRASAGWPSVPLPFTGLTDGDFGSTKAGYYRFGYRSAKEECIEVNGLPTLPAATLAAMKLRAGRPKDIAGIVQAHVLGVVAGNPITETEPWQRVMSQAEEILGAGDIHAIASTGNDIPEWLGSLAQHTVSLTFNSETL